MDTARLEELKLLISWGGRATPTNTVAQVTRREEPLSKLVAWIAEALDLGCLVYQLAELSGLPRNYMYAIQTYRRRRTASQIAAVLTRMPKTADHDTVDKHFGIADARMPVMVLLFGTTSWLDEDEIRALLPEDERTAPIRMHRVMNLCEAQYYLQQVKQDDNTGLLRLLAFGHIDNATATALGLVHGPIP